MVEGSPAKAFLGLRWRSLLGVPPLVVLLVHVFHGFVLHSLAAVSLAFARPVVARAVVCACGALAPLRWGGLGLCWGIQGLRVHCGCGLCCLRGVLVVAGVLLSCARLRSEARTSHRLVCRRRVLCLVWHQIFDLSLVPAAPRDIKPRNKLFFHRCPGLAVRCLLLPCFTSDRRDLPLNVQVRVKTSPMPVASPRTWDGLFNSPPA